MPGAEPAAPHRRAPDARRSSRAPRCSARSTPRSAAPTSTSITESSTSRFRSFPATFGRRRRGDRAASCKDINGNAIKEGDIVTFLDVHETCNNCYYCLVARQPTKCPHRKVYGITYSANDGLLGGWAEAIWMKPGVKMIKLPKELTPETFIGGGCGLVTALHAVDMAEIKLGESVAVLGVGPVGQSCVAFASLSGAGEIVAIGAPRDAARFRAADGRDGRRSGSTCRRSARVEGVRGLTGGRGVDVVIEASGAPDAVQPGARHGARRRPR